jgi:hypothetical protein
MKLLVSKLERLVGGGLQIEIGQLAYRKANSRNEIVRGEYSISFFCSSWRFIDSNGRILLGNFDYNDEYIASVFFKIVDSNSIDSLCVKNKDTVIQFSTGIVLETYYCESESEGEGYYILNSDGVEITEADIPWKSLLL